MSANDALKSNIDRLLTHLKDGSLAALLVSVHQNPGGVDRAESIKVVLRERLKHVRKKLGAET